MKPLENRILILTSVFNDWDSLALLLKKLDRALAPVFPEIRFEVLAIDDGSSRWNPDFLSGTTLERIAKVEVLHLRSNLGHQRALAVGLAHAETRRDRAVVVMDADGEDDPEDVPRLITAMLGLGETKIVFAERTLRSERFLFRFFYRLYQFLHLCLTGLSIKVGNFSIIPAKCLSPLGVLSDMWNHYAATVYKSRLPFEAIRAKRAKRLLGDSTMSFSSLVVHGLSALSVHGELIGFRLLVVNGIAALTAVTAVAFVLALHFAGQITVPAHFFRWMLVGGLMLAQGLGLSLFFAFIVLKTRATSGFLPARDFSWFVGSLESIPLRDSRLVEAA